MDFSQLLKSEYYLDSNPGGDFLPGYVLLIFFFLVIFSGSIIKKKAANNKYLKKSIKNRLWKFIILGMLGIILVAARFSTVPVISMRIWLYIVLLLTIGFGIHTYYRVRKDYQKRLDSVEREKKKQG